MVIVSFFNRANQDAQSRNDNRQVYLHNPSNNLNINSHFENGLDLDNIPHTPVGDNDSSSPKLVPLDSAFSDPGLSSPYIGAQRHLAKVQALSFDTTEEQPHALSTLSPMPSRPSSPALPSDNDDETRNSNSNSATTTSDGHNPQSNYSPMIAVMIVSSLSALALLGLAVAVAYVSQLFRITVLQGSVWRTIANANKTDSSNISTSDKPKVPNSELNKLISEEDLNEKNPIALTRQIPSELLSEKTSHLEEDPEIPPVPHSSPALRGPPADNNLVFGRVALAWTYDNWLTHFMFALFGWMGMFLRGSGQRPN